MLYIMIYVLIGFFFACWCQPCDEYEWMFYFAFWPIGVALVVLAVVMNIYYDTFLD